MWPKQSECDQFYGNPRGRNGLASSTWEAANLVTIPIPWAAVASWEPATKIKRIRCHRKVSASLERVLAAIWLASGCSQAKIAEWGMDQYGGGYQFRAMRGGNRLSTHAYGIAQDWDPARNGMGDKTPNFANCPEVIAAFKAEGWECGIDWASPDAMHFQAARL